jgi:hypothetical protein
MEYAKSGLGIIFKRDRMINLIFNLKWALTKVAFEDASSLASEQEDLGSEKVQVISKGTKMKIKEETLEKVVGGFEIIKQIEDLSKAED